MNNIKNIGIIAEDDSDFDSLKILINKILSNEHLRLGFKKCIGDGCGKIKRKADDYIKDLDRRDCKIIILVQDSDGKDVLQIKKEFIDKINTVKIKGKYLICIPVQEIEAWLLSDPNAIKQSLKLKMEPKIKGFPENQPSPKEFLGTLIKRCSNNNIIYLNTKHNAIISEKISIDSIYKKCISFKELYDFIKNEILT